jgi:hypothetical protein
MIYATKESLEVTVVNYMYIALSMPIGLEILIEGGRPTDMYSRCLVEK